jgi:hypothetical protein
MTTTGCGTLSGPLHGDLVDESVARDYRHSSHHRGTSLAVAQENEFVSSAGRHHRRSAGLQVLFSDHDDADCERGTFDHCMVDAALGIDAVFTLAETYQASRQAALWRFAEVHDYPVAAAIYHPLRSAAGDRDLSR